MKTAFIVIFVALLVSAGAWWYYQSGKSLPVKLPLFSSSQSETKLTDTQQQLLFVRDPNPDQNAPADLQAWLIKPDGTKESQTDLPTFTSAFKYPNRLQIFFTQAEFTDSFFVKNLATGEIEHHTPLRHPDPEVDEHVSLYELNNIAPDGSVVLFSTMYTTKCPEVSPLPGFQGGSSRCEPDPIPDVPVGYYLYNLTTKTATHLGDTIAISRWDTDNRALYYIDHAFNNAGLRKIDLKTQEITTVDQATTFGYAAYPLFTRPLLLKHIGSTSDSGDASMSQNQIVNLETGVTTGIDSGQWADLQPFMTVFPDESGFLYLRTEHVNGLQVGSLHRHDFTTNTTEQLTPYSTTQSYSIRGTWVDDSHFVTAVDPIEQEGYDNTNQYLVNINVQTGEIKPLTEANVARFNVF